MASLRVEQLSKTIGGVSILHDVDFEVGDGQFYALLGPSGSGKTTILKTIAGFSDPDRGRIVVDDVDVTDVPPHRRNLGVVFQNYALFPHLTVAANVEFGLRMRRVPRAEAAVAVAEALELVGITRLASRRPAQLSGGEQQRVALARALVIRPALLLLDEPLSALDRKIRQELQVELKRVQQQTHVTTIMVTHDQEEVQFLADELLVLESGRIRQVGAPVDVYRNPSDVFVAGFMGISNVWDGVLRFGTEGAIAEGGGLALPTNVRGTASDGTPIVISVRPEDVVVSSTTMHTNGTRSIKAVVENVEIVGPLARLRVRAGELSLSSLELARAVDSFRVGTPVSLSIDPTRVTWYPAEGDERPR